MQIRGVFSGDPAEHIVDAVGSGKGRTVSRSDTEVLKAVEEVLIDQRAHVMRNEMIRDRAAIRQALPIGQRPGSEGLPRRTTGCPIQNDLSLDKVVQVLDR